MAAGAAWLVFYLGLLAWEYARGMHRFGGAEPAMAVAIVILTPLAAFFGALIGAVVSVCLAGVRNVLGI